jgi:hypothetical protein
MRSSGCWMGVEGGVPFYFRQWVHGLRLVQRWLRLRLCLCEQNRRSSTVSASHWMRHTACTICP